MTPPFSYYGGKQKIVKRVLSYFPEHRAYVEPFCGGATMFFAKNQSPVEVINDLNGRIVNFMRVLRDQPDALYKALELIPYSETEHKQATARIKMDREFHGVDDAVDWFVSISTAFAREFACGFGFSKTNREALRFENNKRRLLSCAERVLNATIHCRDALDVIRRYDSEQTLFYIDPPYVGTNQGHYSGYSEEQFAALVDTLSNCAGKVILSSYQTDLVPSDWQLVEIETLCSASRQSNSSGRVECLYMKNLPVSEPTLFEDAI